MSVVWDETDSDGTLLFLNHDGAEHYAFDEGVDGECLHIRAFESFVLQIVQHGVCGGIEK